MKYYEELSEDDKILLRAAQEKEAMRRKEIKSKHKYSIYFKPSSGRWYTKVIKNGKPSDVAYKTEKALYDYLEKYYKDAETVETAAEKEAREKREQEEKERREEELRRKLLTVAAVYEEWLASMSGKMPQTLQKHTSNWRSYFAGTAFSKHTVWDLTEEDIEECLKILTIKHGWKKKQLLEKKSLLNLVLDYAVKKKYIAVNPARQIHGLTKSDWIVPDEETEPQQEIFYEDEEQLLCEAAVQAFHKTGSPLFLAIPLGFQTGCRVGEMTALKFKDADGKMLTLRRSEHTCYEQGIKKETGEAMMIQTGFVVRPGLKAGKKERTIPLTSEAISIIDMLKDHYGEVSQTDWLFHYQDGKRYSGEALSSCLRKLCKKIGLPPRSYHKIRKTYVSRLLDSGLPITTVRDLAGHKTAELTLNTYGHSLRTSDALVSDVEKALVLR